MDIVMPQLGETVAEGTVTVWHKKPGDHVEANELLFEVSTDKVDTEIPAPAAGTLVEVIVQEGETVEVGAQLGILQVEGEEAVAASAAPAAPPKAPKLPADKRATIPVDPSAPPPPVSPVVGRLLAEHGLSAEDVAGTGAGGRIKRKDVLGHVAALNDHAGSRLAPAGDHTVIPFNNARKRTAEHMVRSKTTSPHVLQAVEVDFFRVAAVRAERGDDWKAREGFSLTYLPFIARAVCQAIGDFPNINASIRDDSLLVWQAVNLGIAVDLDFDGLVAPVLRDAHRMTVPDLARAIAEIAAKARDKSLSPDDFAGGTYTISNSGVFGTMITAPIINQPQVAILSTDGIQKRPVVIESDGGDQIVARPVGILAQSFDHRAIDGAYSAAFLKRIKDIIEETDWETALD